MKKHSQQGMTMVEVLVALAIFAVLSTVGYQVYTTASSIAQRSRLRSQALWFSEEGIEATRSIRDKDYTLLTAGTKGLALSGNTWTFSGTSDTNGIFTRAVTLTALSTDSRQVDSVVTWNYKGAANTTTLTTVLTNWQKRVSMADALTVDTTLANLSLLDLQRLLTGITLTADGTSGTVSITQVNVTWTTSARRLQAVRSPNLSNVWTGSVASGTTVTLTTPITLTGATSRSFQLRFDSSMAGNTFVITLIMSDGTSKAFTITNPPTGV